MVKAVINVITNRRIKYVFLVFWLVVVAVAAPLAGKLTGAQKNDARIVAAGRRRVDPGARRQARVQVAGHHPGRRRLRAAGRAHPRRPGQGQGRRRRRSRRLPEPRRRRSIGPIPSEDGQAPQIIVPINLGTDGWDKAARRRRRPCATSPKAGANGLTVHITGPAGHRGRLGRGVRGHRQHAAARHARRRRGHPAVHLPQPGAVDPAGVLGGRRADRRPGGHLPAGQARRPDRQRAERRHPDRAGLRRRHRLRAAARRPLPRGAAPARGPARGDGRGAAPRRPGDPRQRRHRHRRHALPAVRRDELHPGSRPGRRHRHRGRRWP